MRSSEALLPNTPLGYHVVASPSEADGTRQTVQMRSPAMRNASARPSDAGSLA